MQIAPTGNRGLASQSLQFAPFTAGPFFSIIRFLLPRLTPRPRFNVLQVTIGRTRRPTPSRTMNQSRPRIKYVFTPNLRKGFSFASLRSSTFELTFSIASGSGTEASIRSLHRTLFSSLSPSHSFPFHLFHPFRSPFAPKPEAQSY